MFQEKCYQMGLFGNGRRCGAFERTTAPVVQSECVPGPSFHLVITQRRHWKQVLEGFCVLRGHFYNTTATVLLYLWARIQMFWCWAKSYEKLIIFSLRKYCGTPVISVFLEYDQFTPCHIKTTDLSDSDRVYIETIVFDVISLLVHLVIPLQVVNRQCLGI